jgi:hypothetical protein
VTACIEDPKVIEQILKHLKQKADKAEATKQHESPPKRAPPLAPSLFAHLRAVYLINDLKNLHCKLAQQPVEQLTSSEPSARVFAAKPNLIRAIFAGPMVKVAT